MNQTKIKNGRKKAKRKLKSKVKKKLDNIIQALKKNIVYQLYNILLHHFPDFFDKLLGITDFRKKTNYPLSDLLMACISMFLFKKGSRNAANNERNESQFKTNYEKVFKVRMPHMDTVNLVMKQIKEDELESLKTELVQKLIKKKVFNQFRLFDKLCIVVDATRVINVKESHCEHCLFTTSSKTGKKTYFHNVLEAKLVGKNGFCISLATEWVENPVEYNKQDCESKAFKRLAEKLKKYFPRQSLCILADGLYPNQTFFGICKENKWDWIVTFKDGNLPSVWETVINYPILGKNTKDKTRTNTNKEEIKHSYIWINNINYHDYTLNWFECVETIGNTSKRFVHISSLYINHENIITMTASGRMRWKVENEGFDIQKNHGYGLKHKYSRVSMKAFKNYYQCMQIAHLINQLFELSNLFKPLLTNKTTVVHLWTKMLGQMRELIMDSAILESHINSKIQLRY